MNVWVIFQGGMGILTFVLATLVGLGWVGLPPLRDIAMLALLGVSLGFLAMAVLHSEES
jgi:hypothetical protein